MRIAIIAGLTLFFSAATALAQGAAPERVYHLHDKVQVNVRGQGWFDGEIVSIAEGIETEYKVAVSGNRFALASYRDLRFVAAAPAAAPALGKPPKPGLASCAGKFEGRYGPAGGGPGPTIVFRSGKAMVREPDMVMTDGKLSAMSSDHEAECWTGNGKIYLRWLDGSAFDFPIDVNDDGTIDTPEGTLKKKGS